jgi:hypothetical protein
MGSKITPDSAHDFQNTSIGTWKFKKTDKQKSPLLISTDFFIAFYLLPLTFFFTLLFFNSSSSSLFLSSSSSSFLRSTSARVVSRFSLRQVMTVVVANPTNDVMEVINEPIKAVEFTSLELCEEGSTALGLPVDGVGVTIGPTGAGRLRLVCENTNNINAPKVERVNKTRKILPVVFKLFPDHGFFLKRTSTRFFEQSLKVSI